MLMIYWKKLIISDLMPMYFIYELLKLILWGGWGFGWVWGGVVWWGWGGGGGGGGDSRGGGVEEGGGVALMNSKIKIIYILMFQLVNTIPAKKLTTIIAIIISS